VAESFELNPSGAPLLHVEWKSSTEGALPGGLPASYAKTADGERRGVAGDDRQPRPFTATDYARRGE
jgi:hypothetical protein